MKRLILPTVVGLLALTPLGLAQPPRYYPPGRDYFPARPRSAEEDLARYWYKSYFRRPASPREMARVADLLRGGQRPEDVLASLLGGREYLDYSGGTPEGLVTQLFLDVGHHEPSYEEVDSVLRNIDARDRRGLADWFLQQYPQNWIPGLPASPPPDYDDYDYRWRR
jgi:hypothetical protein